jgi:WD40 repeat protein
MSAYSYQVGGSLNPNAPSYIWRNADAQLYEQLQSGEFCYILNARQMGKSSLLASTKYRLQAQGVKCATIDLTSIGSEQTTPAQWYKGVASELWRGLALRETINFKQWWQARSDCSLVQRLHLFLDEILLAQCPDDRFVIFIDEIDSIFSLDFGVDDFFALIRFCYDRRAIEPDYQRITFAIFGVAAPSDLIRDCQRTPFNIGYPIELRGFTLVEAQPLADGLAHRVENPQLALQAILSWTNGQPFLTQKLCQIIVQSQCRGQGELEWVEHLVRSHIIAAWETQDDPEHLKTIRDRLLHNEQQTGRVLGIYQSILEQEGSMSPKAADCILPDETPEQIELILSGLVQKNHGCLTIANRIYQEVFNRQWVEKQLAQRRPYSQNFEAWMVSQQRDRSRLLRGQALRDAQQWAYGKSLSDGDYRFLAQSGEVDRQEVQQALEAARLREVEVRLAQQKHSVKRQRGLLVAVSVLLLLACGLGATAFWQYRRAAVNERMARLNEVQAIATSSEALFASNRTLDALVQALAAYSKQQHLGQSPPKLVHQINTALLQALFRVSEFNRLLGHKSLVWDVALSPDGKTLASVSGDSTIHLWQPDGTLLETFTLGGEGAISVAFSPDGQTLAVSGGNGSIELRQRLETGGFGPNPSTLLRSHQGTVRSVAFSPDGQILASAGDDRTVKLWTRNGTLLRTLPRHRGRVRSVAFSPDGQTLASAGDDRTIKLSNLDGKLLRTFSGHQGQISSLAFSPDGQTLASASEDRTIKLWKPDGQVIGTLRSHSAAVGKVVFSPDGRFLASASCDKTVKLWHRDSRLASTLVGHSDRVRGVAFSPDSQILASTSEDRTVRLWRPENPLLTPAIGHNAAIVSLDFSPDGQTLASGSDDKTVKLWRLNGQLLYTLKGHQVGVLDVAFNPRRSLLASASWDGTITLWQLDGRARPRLIQMLYGHMAPVWAVDWSPDGSTLVSASWDKTLKVWQLNASGRSVKLQRTLTGHESEVRDVAFSPDGKWLASASLDKTVRLWTRDGTLYRVLNSHDLGVMAVAFSLDGSIASAGFDRSIRLWKSDGTLENTSIGDQEEVPAVAFSPDGETIALIGGDDTIQLWKRDGTLLTTLNGHSGAIGSIAFSPDGEYLASAGSDKTVLLWNWGKVANADMRVAYACEWVRAYLRSAQTSISIEEARRLCN